MSTLPSDRGATTGAGHPTLVVTTARSVHQYNEVVRHFTVVADELGVSRLSDSELRDLCQMVAALSNEIFSDEMSIEVRGDPEIPGELHFTFDVVAAGSADEIVAASNQWHLRLRQMIGKHAELFCLSFDIR